jgi:hypothetical protein
MLDDFWKVWPLLKTDGQRAVYITDCSRHLMFKLRTVDNECRVDLLWADDKEKDLSRMSLSGIRVYWSVMFQNKHKVVEISNYDVMSRVFDSFLK